MSDETERDSIARAKEVMAAIDTYIERPDAANRTAIRYVLIGELEDLQHQLDNERAKGIHSCHANCQRDGCVNRRLRATLDEAVAALKGLHHVCKLALTGKDGRQYAYFESRAGHFVEASAVMQEAEATLAKLGGTA